MKLYFLMIIGVFLIEMKIVFSQDRIYMYDDTVIHSIVIPLKKGVFFPVNTDSIGFCLKLKQAWIDYLRANKEVVSIFKFEDNTLGYSASFWMDISDKGKVTSFKLEKFPTKVDSVCFDAIKKTILSSDWRPAYRRKKYKNIYFNTKLNASVSILRGLVLELTIYDLDQGYPFFRCNKCE